MEGAHLVKRKGEADEERYDIAIDGFFLAIGHKPNTDVFRPFVDCDETGYIKTVDGTPRTNVEGVFAAGDCADPNYARLSWLQARDARLRSRLSAGSLSTTCNF